MTISHTKHLDGETVTESVELPEEVAQVINDRGKGKAIPGPENIEDQNGNVLAWVYVGPESSYIDFSPNDRASFPNKGLQFISRFTGGSFRSKRPLGEIQDLILLYAGEKDVNEMDVSGGVQRFADAAEAYSAGADYSVAKKLVRGSLRKRLLKGVKAHKGRSPENVKKEYTFRNGLTLITHYGDTLTVIGQGGDEVHVADDYNKKLQNDLFMKAKQL